MTRSASQQQPVPDRRDVTRLEADADNTAGGQVTPQPAADRQRANAPADTAVSPGAGNSVLGWTPGDRRFALIAGVLMLALLFIHWGRLAWRGSPAVEIHRLEAAENRFQLDINSATWVEWMQLEGVGETLSRRIVNDREQNGPFESVDDIQRVRGIGPKTLEQLRPWLHCADCPTQPAADTPDNP